MTKEGKLVKSWKVRYAVLFHPGVLVYAEDDAILGRVHGINSRVPNGWAEELEAAGELAKAAVLGTVRVTAATPVVRLAMHAGRSNVFSVRAMAPSSRIFFFQCETREQVDGWAAAIAGMPARPPDVAFPVVPTPAEREEYLGRQRLPSNPFHRFFEPQQAQPQQQARQAQQAQPQAQQPQAQQQAQQQQPAGMQGLIGGIVGGIMAQMQAAQLAAAQAQQQAAAAAAAGGGAGAGTEGGGGGGGADQANMFVEVWSRVNLGIGKAFTSKGRAPIYVNGTDMSLYVEAWKRIGASAFTKVDRVPLYDYQQLDADLYVKGWKQIGGSAFMSAGFVQLPPRRPL